MKKMPPVWLPFLLSCISCIVLFASESIGTAASSSNISSTVTASDYCYFLNQAATSDPYFLYDEKMGADPQTASIVRSGLAGNFHYEVIAGRENIPITFVGQNDAEAYCEWKSDVTFKTDEERNSSLKSNQNDFQIAIPSSLTLSLVSSSISHLPSSNHNSCVEKIGIIGTFLGLAVFGNIGMTEEGDMSQAAAEHSPLTLDHFKTAAEAHPTAKRLLIKNKAGSWQIEPSYLIGPQFLFRNMSAKNSQIAAVLKLALQHEYGSSIANQILLEEKHRANWSSQRIDRIIQQADEMRYPAIDELMEAEAQQFPGARVIQQFSEQGNLPDQTKRIRILKTNLKYPIVRIEEEISPERTIINRTAMVADHISLTLEDGKDINSFYSQLKQKLPFTESTTWLEEHVPSFTGLYRLHIKLNFLGQFSQILVASQEIAATSGIISEPNFLSNCIYSNDPK